MTYDQWYEAARLVVLQEYDDAEQVLAGLTLLEQAGAVKQGSAAAKEWFDTRDGTGMTLDMVCDLLGMNIHDVRNRLRRMEERCLSNRLQKG